MNNQRVSIQDPCHMNWKGLDKIQNSKNRHCNECSMDIIDFSHLSNEEIIKFLSEREREKVCSKMYSVDKHSNLSKVQNKILNWHENVKSNLKNNYFKSMVLAFAGLMITVTGCVKEVGEPVPPCREEFVPDTTTAVPNDSIIVEICQ